MEMHIRPPRLTSIQVLTNLLVGPFLTFKTPLVITEEDGDDHTCRPRNPDCRRAALLFVLPQKPQFIFCNHGQYSNLKTALKFPLKIIREVPCRRKYVLIRFYCISAFGTQHIKSGVLLQLVTFGYMFRPLPGHHQANKE